MLYSLGMTGCCSRVALNKMLRRIRKELQEAAMQINLEALLLSPDQSCSYLCLCLR